MKNLLFIPIAALMLFSCQNNKSDRGMTLNQEKQYSIDSMKVAMQQQMAMMDMQRSIDSMKHAMAKPAARGSPTGP